MKRVRVLLLIMVAIFGFSGVSNASLWDRGGGLIYDEDLDITWLQDANYAQTSGYDDSLYGYDTNGRMSWSDAVAWADQLVYGGYDDWRLPTTVDGEYEWGFNGDTTAGYNITSSEMGYMYYVNLGNLGAFEIYKGPRPDGTYGLKNTGPFINLRTLYPYWSGTLNAVGMPSPVNAWVFYFSDGEQLMGAKVGNRFFAWAVRDGDVAAVPIPGTVWLFGSGLASLIAIIRKIKF
ncbi:MAG: DUF1566 domain-containing protein [Desulfobulbaceae bacterium]|nr:DUF1566 domain-containing protein [Desulfobulbaceae bacterium]